MTTEQEIITKLDATLMELADAGGDIFYRTAAEEAEKAIHEAYEAGLDSGASWLTRGADLQNAKNKTAQAIFAELDRLNQERLGVIGEAVKLKTGKELKTDILWVNIKTYQALKQKYLKGNFKKVSSNQSDKYPRMCPFCNEMMDRYHECKAKP